MPTGDEISHQLRAEGDTGGSNAAWLTPTASVHRREEAEEGWHRQYDTSAWHDFIFEGLDLMTHSSTHVCSVNNSLKIGDVSA